MKAIAYPARARRELVRLLGVAEAAAVLSSARALAPAMLACADDRGSAVVHRHQRRAIVPVAALYHALRERVGRERALDLTLAVMRVMFDALPRQLRVLRALPARFALFRAANRFVLRTQFPSQGWSCEMVEDNDHCFAYTMRSCCYVETYTLLGVPEVAPLSCQMDEIAYASLPSDISFERTHTLAAGDDCCDFTHRNLRAVPR